MIDKGGRILADGIIEDVALGSKALAFAVDVRHMETMDEIASRVIRLMTPLGLTAVASGLVSGPKAVSGSPFHFTNWPEDWIARYMAEGFLLVDPLPRWARNSGLAQTWGDLIQRLPARDPGRKVIEAAALSGYTEGMVVPLRAADNSLGLVSFGGSRERLHPIEQEFLAVIARAAFDAAERIERRSDAARAAPILSAREIECLVLLTRGHSNRQIAKLLGLSEPTVRFHVTNARDKSGAASRTHLAALAVAQGYVTL